jgi:1,4-alpha-glucan branching enzyme
MVAMARKYPLADGLLKRALNQMARELLLAQSSDWAFIMTTGTTVPYAVRRTRDHINRFTGLFDQVSSDRLHEDSLREIEWRDSVFQEIDYRVYA